MARWCLLTGQAPDVWHHLTRLERRTFITELNHLTRK
jgi:hypothetical protein